MFGSYVRTLAIVLFQIFVVVVEIVVFFFCGLAVVGLENISQLIVSIVCIYILHFIVRRVEP